MKKNVVNELKTLSLTKTNRKLLLSLIELFDSLSLNEKFLVKLERLANEEHIQQDEELKLRLLSLQTQLDTNKNLKIDDFSWFSTYHQVDKIEIYLKTLPASWDRLIEEIKLVKFDYISVYVYKSLTKKEKISSSKLTKANWEEDLEKILDTNIHVNIKIILVLEKLM